MVSKLIEFKETPFSMYQGMIWPSSNCCYKSFHWMVKEKGCL